MIFFLHLSCNFIPTNEQLKMLARSCGCIVRSSQTTWVNEKRESHYRIKCYWLYLLCKRIVYSKKIQQHAICAHVMIPSCLDFFMLQRFFFSDKPSHHVRVLVFHLICCDFYTLADLGDKKLPLIYYKNVQILQLVLLLNFCLGVFIKRTLGKWKHFV